MRAQRRTLATPKKVSKQTRTGVPSLSIVVQDVSDLDSTPTTREIRTWIKRGLGGEARGELSIRIVDEAESAALNLRYRGRRGATNVLSFSGTDLPADMDSSAGVLGDLVVCAPVIAREAAAKAKSIDAHWAHVLLHGVLHLLGYDHESDAQAQLMERRETELLAALGFDDPHASEC